MKTDSTPLFSTQRDTEVMLNKFDEIVSFDESSWVLSDIKNQQIYLYIPLQETKMVDCQNLEETYKRNY